MALFNTIVVSSYNLPIDGPEFGVRKSGIKNITTSWNFAGGPLFGVMASKVPLQSFVTSVIIIVVPTDLRLSMANSLAKVVKVWHLDDLVRFKVSHPAN
jgi:hypothetical protein